MATPPSTPPTISDTLERAIAGRLQSLPPKDDTSVITIFRVPAHVREASKHLYEPRMVSIGPYYHGREELRAMEQLKLWYLRDFLERGGTGGGQKSLLSSYVKAVLKDAEKARRSYYEKTKLFGIGKEASVQPVPSDSRHSAESSEQEQAPSDGFAEMLLLDGCFILEVLFKQLKTKDSPEIRRQPKKEEEADSLQRVGWGVDLLTSDLLLLENQIPFFVLVSLYELVSTGMVKAPTMTPKNQLVHDLFGLLPNDGFSQKISGTVFDIEIHHLLHLYHQGYVPKPEPRDGDNSPYEQAPPQTPGATSPQDPEEEDAPGSKAQKQRNSRLKNTVIPCTTQLREAGVQFERKEKPKNMFDITFSKGVMEIPRFEIDHARTPLLVNLIAFEQSTAGKKGAEAPLTSYTALMSALVRTGKDVEVLQKHGIINNMLSSEDDAAKSYFNHLGTCCTLDYDQHYYASEFVELNKYYESKWNHYTAKFGRDYCANPWSIMAAIVAVLVVFFSISKLIISIYRLFTTALPVDH